MLLTKNPITQHKAFRLPYHFYLRFFFFFFLSCSIECDEGLPLVAHPIQVSSNRIKKRIVHHTFHVSLTQIWKSGLSIIILFRSVKSVEMQYRCYILRFAFNSTFSILLLVPRPLATVHREKFDISGFEACRFISAVFHLLQSMLLLNC